MKKQKSLVPEWAKKVVWYQIFPERFRNGDKSNDPTIKTLKGAWPHDDRSPWQVHPWTSDWYELQPYEKKNGKDFWYNVHRRRYGGDLQGIIDKLDYLQQLGISALYLNPVFAAPSNHKYDAYCYHHIDPNFGPDPEGDIRIINSEKFDKPDSWKWTAADKLMLELIAELHKRGMKIIFDGVFNHMGLNTHIFIDVQMKQNKSRYKNWLKVLSWNDKKLKTKFDYTGWAGYKELPEWNQDENGIVDEPKKYIFDITKRWMDPAADGDISKGIDGWRLDVAYCVKHNFWKLWRKHVKAINPDAYLTAEVIGPIEELKPYLQGDEFDAVMNYNFAFAATEFFVNKKNRITVSEFDRKLKSLRNAFPQGFAYVQQNLFDSHDTNRMASHIVNCNLSSYRNWAEYFEISKAINFEYKTRKPNIKEYAIQKLMVIFQMTYLGAPMVYYGDEAGMWGANDPDCRKPMVWDDMIYDDEKKLADQSVKSKADKVRFYFEMFNHYKKLIDIRNKYCALQTGSFKTVLIEDKKQIYAFERKLGRQVILVIINNSGINRKIKMDLTGDFLFCDELNNAKVKSVNKKLSILVAAKWARILVRE